MLTLKLAAPNLTKATARLRRDVEKGFAVCGLLLLPASDVVWQGFILAAFAVTFLILARNWNDVRAFLGTGWPILLPVLIAACSVLWSVDPEVSLYRVIALAGTAAFGAFLAIRFNLKEQLMVLALALGIIACASTLVSILLPGYGVMTGSHNGAWSGIFYHKNSLGRIMALATLVFFLLALGFRELRLVALPAMALSIALVFASQSRASLIVAIACLTVISVLSAVQRLPRSTRTVVLLVTAMVGISAAGWAIKHGDSILALVGTDPTLTGRTELWSVLFEKARARPWFGYGYGAFWRGATGVSGEVQKALNWDWYPIHAHNGFLDLVLELGIVGLLVFLLPLGIYGYRAFRWGLAQRSPLRLWPLAYLLFLILGNVAESALVRQNNIYWALYVAAILTTCNHNSPPGEYKSILAFCSTLSMKQHSTDI
ncbi:MAG TPA: O-antigen ligase, partial [Methylomirabilota bacterium]|nr:O-antigen ligase [Methylomirabilota bacterium]